MHWRAREDPLADALYRTPYAASPLGRVWAHAFSTSRHLALVRKTLCSAARAMEPLRLCGANELARDVTPSGRGPTLAEVSIPITLCADVGAAASPVRPAAGRSLAPGPGAPLPWRRSAHNKAEEGQQRERARRSGFGPHRSALGRDADASPQRLPRKPSGPRPVPGRDLDGAPPVWDPTHTSWRASHGRKRALPSPSSIGRQATRARRAT
jgi:hypothetical protein